MWMYGIHRTSSYSFTRNNFKNDIDDGMSDYPERLDIIFHSLNYCKLKRSWNIFYTLKNEILRILDLPNVSSVVWSYSWNILFQARKSIFLRNRFNLQNGISRYIWPFTLFPLWRQSILLYVLLNRPLHITNLFLIYICRVLLLQVSSHAIAICMMWFISTSLLFIL